MRKIITTLLALTALAAVAQPAMAVAPEGDDPLAFVDPVWTRPDGSGIDQHCISHRTVGVPGQGGAWGNYVAGCSTDKLECPATRNSCIARVFSNIHVWTDQSTMSLDGDEVTMNSRTRIFGPGETTTGRWRDFSCHSRNWCVVQDRFEIQGGESVSVQCNGVRQPTANRTADAECQLGLDLQ